MDTMRSKLPRGWQKRALRCTCVLGVLAMVGCALPRRDAPPTLYSAATPVDFPADVRFLSTDRASVEAKSTAASDWDSQLTEAFTGGRGAQMSVRGLLALPLGTKRRSAVLAALVDHYVTTDLIRAVAGEAGTGRLLWVATTDMSMETRRPRSSSRRRQPTLHYSISAASTARRCT